MKKVFYLSIFSRILLLLGTYLLFILYGSAGQDNSLSGFLGAFAGRWDGPHYLFLAEHGYVTTGVERLFIVFPPFYPVMIKIAGFFFNNLTLAAVVVSNLFFILACLTFYKLLRLDYDENFSFWVIFLLCFFPTAFFFSTSYAESLFLFLFCASFLLIRKNRFGGAGLLAGLLTLTKPFGLIIWPALFLEWFKSSKRSWLNLAVILSLMVLSGGLYLGLNYFLFHDFLAFQKFLEMNWFKSFAWPWVGLLESWKRGFQTPEWSTYKIYIGFAEAITSTLAWLVALIGLTKWTKLRLSHALYLFLGVLFFTSTSYILSSPRYLLSLPPFFIILTHLTSNKILRFLWLIFSVILLFYLSLLFIQGQWAF